jgi:hypothetical protein
MARIEWSFTTPWVAVAEVAVVMSALVGAMVGRGLARMGRTAQSHSGVVSDDQRSVLRAPAVWASIFAMNGGAMGIVWLMTTKLDWTISIAVPLVFTVAGVVAGMAVSKSRKGRTSSWEPIPSLLGRHAS